MTIINFKGTPTRLSGDLPTVGSLAPDFVVTNNDLSEIRLKHYLGRKIVMNIFPSLDTTTCAQAMKRFNEVAQQFKNILILCISADLPFAQQRFCLAEHLENVRPVSTFRHPEFGITYGVKIEEGPLQGLLGRAVLAIDENGKILYTELVKEISEEPNYSGLIAALQKSEPL